MRLALAILFVAAFSSGLRAEPVVVQSGEHADFSRLVMQFPGPVDWAFGRVDSGYALRLASGDIEFDLSRVFRFIPRDRIQDVVSPKPGRLVIRVTCECSGDAFEIRRGRLVVDIKEGAPGPGARFEARLPPELPQVGDRPELEETEVLDSQPPTALQTVGRNSQVVGIEPAHRVPAQGKPQAVRLPEDPPFRPLPVSSAGAHPSVSNMVSRGAPTQENNDGTAVSRPRNAIMKTGVSVGPEPAFPDIMPALMPAQAYERVAEIERDLLRQLGRASTQGLILIDRPELDAYLRIQEAETTTENDLENSASSISEPALDPVDQTHVRVETAADRAARFRERQSAVRETDIKCLPAELFDLAAWGPTDGEASPFSDLRMRLVGEFDLPRPDVVVELVRRNIYFGFGAEALAVLGAFENAAGPDDTLRDLAAIVDGRAVEDGSQLPGQIGCSTNAALWAVLSEGPGSSVATVDERAVLRAFMELPTHLQTLLGPRLAEWFLASGDVDTATAIRDIKERSGSESDQAFEMLEARLESQNGDTDAAIRKLNDIAHDGGDEQASALVQFINQTIDRGQPVSESTLLLAEALSVEYRDTDIGHSLVRALIRGLVASGAPEDALRRIDEGLKRRILDPQEAEMLRGEALLAISRLPSDAAFLIAWAKAAIQPGEQNDPAIRARIVAAGRLVDIGLPERAIALFSSHSNELSSAEKLVVARAHLMSARPEKVLETLAGLGDKEALTLVAAAMEMKGDHLAAAAVYEQLEQSERALRAVWKAGDWSGLPAIAGSDEALSPAPVDRALDQAMSISAGRSLVADSSTTRKLVSRLLETSPIR